MLRRRSVMRLTKIHIQDFRQFEDRSFELIDALGRPRSRVLIVGPSGSGKTTLLDAVAVALGPATELSATRVDLKLRPDAIVRTGATEARVRCTVQFSADELDAAKQLAAQFMKGTAVPNVDEAVVDWRYSVITPAAGPTITYEPEHAELLFKPRVWAARLLRSRRGSYKDFERVGGIFTIDQERTSLGKYVRRDLLQILEGGDPGDATEAKVYTRDARAILLELAVRAQVPQKGKTPGSEPFAEIQRRFSELFAPRKMLGVVQDEFGQLDLKFSDGRHQYGFDGLSGGEGMALLLLTKMVSENIHRSIVLAEELELHMHPIWQRKLLYVLGQVGRDNQIIVTTHSPYLMRAVSPEEIIELGDLDDATGNETNHA